MKRTLSVIFTLATVLFLNLGIFPETTAVAGEPVHKRTVNGTEEYQAALLNETKWFVVVLIDGKRMGVLNPAGKYSNMWDGSAQKIWLSLGPHKIIAFAYHSQSDITNDKPSFKTDEASLDISGHVDIERKSNGSFTIPILSLEESSFRPWTTPPYRQHRH